MKRLILLMVSLIVLGFSGVALAEEVGGNASAGHYYYGLAALAAALGVALGAVGAGIGQGLATKGAVEGIARNPGTSGKVTVTLIIGLAMMESLVIYALVVALIIFYQKPFGI